MQSQHIHLTVTRIHSISCTLRAKDLPLARDYITEAVWFKPSGGRRYGDSIPITHDTPRQAKHISMNDTADPASESCKLDL
jgi:hypothetical protein